jgi:hypothetical protein
MLRRVALEITDVSEERIASIIKVTRIDDLGATLAVTSNRRTLIRSSMSCQEMTLRDNGQITNKQTNSVALSPRANYTDRTTATCRRNLVSTFVDRGVSRGQRGGSPTVVNLSFLDGQINFTKLQLSKEKISYTVL